MTGFMDTIGKDVKKLEFRNNTGMSRRVGLESGVHAEYLTIPEGESYLCMCSPWVSTMHAEACKPLILHSKMGSHEMPNLTMTKVALLEKTTYIMTSTSGAMPARKSPEKLNYEMEWMSGGGCMKDYNKRNSCSWNHP